MLFDSSVRRELWRSFIGTLVVLLTVVLTMLLIRILSQATRGAFAPADLSLVLSYTLIGQLPVMVALAFPNVNYVALEDVAGRMKGVPLDCDTIVTARDLGVSFGD